MSKINFMDGSLSGRLEQVVGVKAKSGDFVRRLVKPHDPQTVDQLARRARIKEVAEWGRRWPEYVLRHPTMVLPYRMTWHNRLMVDNQQHINGPPLDEKNWSVHQGPLHFPVTYFTAPEPEKTSVGFYYTNELFGEAEATDQFMCCVHNWNRDTYYRSDWHNRGGSPVVCYIGPILDVFTVYLFGWKPNTNQFTRTVGAQKQYS